MPKIVDHDERRQAIAIAACQAIASKGFDRVTMIDIAKQAGVTTGMIANYFKSKDAIIKAALRVSFQLIEDAVEAKMREGTDNLADMMDAAIPLQAEDKSPFIVWASFWGASASNPAHQGMNMDLHKEGETLYRRAIKQAWPESQNWKDEVFETVMRGVATQLFGLTAGGVSNPIAWSPQVQYTQLRLNLDLLRRWGNEQGPSAH